MSFEPVRYERRLAVSDASPARGLHALTIHPVKSPARELKFPKCHMEICGLENYSPTISAVRSASERVMSEESASSRFALGAMCSSRLYQLHQSRALGLL